MVEMTLPEPVIDRRSRNRKATMGSGSLARWLRLFRHRSMLPLAAFLVIALPGRWLVSGDPASQDLAGRLAPPLLLGGGWVHPLGTDGLGRDILSRIVSGAGLSLLIGVAAAVVSAAIGITVGLLAGTLGGVFDAIATLVGELTLAIPTIVVGIVLTATLGQSFPNLLAILIFTGWISYARIVRLQSRQIVRSEFVEASYAVGARWPWVTLKHVVPNVRSIALVLLCQQTAAVMLWEASLTYLGLGARPDTITLGGIVRDGKEQVFNGWWISVYSGTTIAIAIIGFAFFGDWLREQFDRSTNNGSGLD